MDFGWTPEQELLRSTARDVLAACASPAQVRTMIAGPGLGDADWRRIAALGWPGLLLDEAHGGAGLTMVELAVVLEEMGRAVFPGPFLGTVLAADAIASAGTDAQRDRWLPALADGRLRATVALAEESGKWDAESFAATAVVLVTGPTHSQAGVGEDAVEELSQRLRVGFRRLVVNGPAAR